jgi:hypothetical protein
MEPLSQMGQEKIQNPSELVEIVNDFYRRLAALEFAAKMTRQYQSRLSTAR